MTEIHVEYHDISSLVKNISEGLYTTTVKNSNFVLVRESDFLGSYGGIYNFSNLALLEKKYPLHYAKILDDFMVVWFSIPVNSVGDLSLSRLGYYAVPRDLYPKLRSNVYQGRSFNFYGSTERA